MSPFWAHGPKIGTGTHGPRLPQSWLQGAQAQAGFRKVSKKSCLLYETIGYNMIDLLDNHKYIKNVITSREINLQIYE